MSDISLCFESVNGSCPKFTYPPIIRFSLFVFFGIAIVLTVIGNLLVVISVIHFKQLHTPTNFLIQSLALTDLLVGALLMPPTMVNSVESCWYLGQTYCKIHTSFEVMLCNASVLNLCFIAIDRYFAVCHPLSYQSTITPAVTAIMIMISWCFPGIIGFGIVFLELNMLGLQEFFYNNIYCEGSCIFFQTREFAVVSAVCQICLAIVLVCVYINIYFVAQRQANAIKDRNNLRRAGKESSTIHREKKASRTLAIVLCVYVLLWHPLFLCLIIQPLIGFSIPYFVFDLAVWIAYFNSSCNPLIYALFYSWFRRAMKVIISGWIFQHNSSSMNLFSK